MWWSCSRAEKSCSDKRRGGALIAALLTVAIALLLATSYVDTLTSENKTAKENELGLLALYAADAGIQYALEVIRTTPPVAPLATPHGATAELFKVGGSGSVQFEVEEVGTGCPGGEVIDGLDCRRYRASGVVLDGAAGNQIRARKIVEAVITIGSSGQIISWNEHFI